MTAEDDRTADLADTVPDGDRAIGPRRRAPHRSGERYVRLGELGRGGMGRVVEAIDRELGRVVAIKEALAVNEAAAARFRREIAITAFLDHPAIVAIHDAGETPDGRPFYVMRKINGTPLEDAVVATRSLVERLRLIPSMIAAAEALAHAHARGVLHRDLKPNNIILGELGETVVIDWGLAIRRARPDDLHDAAGAGRGLTRPGVNPGTPGFMSPEQAKGAPLDPRSDVYALGACLYYILAGDLPISGELAAVLAKTIAGDIPPLAARVTGVPRELVAITEKAMAVDRDDRYLDAGGFATDLRRFLEGQLVAAYRYSPARRVARWVRRRRGVVALATVAVLATAIIGGVSISQVFEARDRAEGALAAERERSQQLTIADAERQLGSSPADALATLRRLDADSPRWSQLDGLLLEARARGIATHYPAHGGGGTTALLAPDHSGRVLSFGSGIARVLDPAAATSREVARGTTRLRASWWGSQVVRFGDATFELIDPTTTQRTALTWPTRVSAVFDAGDSLVIEDDASELAVLARGSSAPAALGVRGALRAVLGRWMIVARDGTVALHDRELGGAELGKLPLAKQYQLGGRAPRVLVVADMPCEVPGTSCSTITELELPTLRAVRSWQLPRVYTATFVGEEIYAHQIDGALVRLDTGLATRIATIAVASWPGQNFQQTADGWLAVLREPRRVTLARATVEVEVASSIDLTSILSHGDSLIGIGSAGVLVWRLSELLPEHVVFSGDEHIGVTDDGALLVARPRPAGDRELLRLSLSARPLRVTAQSLATFDEGQSVLLIGDVVALGSPFRFIPEIATADRYQQAITWDGSFALAAVDGAIEVANDRRVARLGAVPVPVEQLDGAGRWLAVAAADQVSRFDRSGERGTTSEVSSPITITPEGVVYGVCRASERRGVCRWDGAGTTELVRVMDEVIRLEAANDRLVVMSRSGAIEVLGPDGSSTRLVESSRVFELERSGRFGVALTPIPTAPTRLQIVIFDVMRGRSWPVGSWSGGSKLAVTRNEVVLREASGALWRFDLVSPERPAEWVRHR